MGAGTIGIVVVLLLILVAVGLFLVFGQNMKVTVEGRHETEVEDLPAVTPDEVPENLDHAMAWLEQLAARQGAPLEELPTVDRLKSDGQR